MWWLAIDGYYVKAFGSCLFNTYIYNVSFFSCFLTSINDFAELPATLVSELGCHVGIHFKQVGFELYI